MADQRNNTKGLTLSAVCDALHISSRKVQYLREQSIVIPTVVGHGRGKPCLYSLNDIVFVWIALVELDGMDYKLRRKILHEVRAEGESGLGDFSSFSVDVASVRARIIALL